MSFKVSNLDYKWLNSMVFSLSYEPCINYTMSGSLAQDSWPKFSCQDGRSFEYKLLSCGIVSGPSLQALHVRAMAQLSLNIGAYDFYISYQRQPLVRLFFGPQKFDSWHECCKME